MEMVWLNDKLPDYHHKIIVSQIPEKSKAESTKTPPFMHSVKEAESTIFNLIYPLDQNRDSERISLETAAGRILAQTLISPLDFPHWDNSAMDGYAVRYADVEKSPTTLEIIEEIPAGYHPQKTVQAGQAARIFTGVVLPEEQTQL